MTRPANGITLSGFKFMTIKAEPDEAIGRKGVRRPLMATQPCTFVQGDVDRRKAKLKACTTGARGVRDTNDPSNPRCRSEWLSRMNGEVDLKNAQYDAPTQAGDANIVVTKLADYLKSVGY